MKIEYFTIDELNYFKEHCDFTEDELYLLDEKSKGKTLEETGFDINTLKSVKNKIRKALEDRKTKTMTVVEIKEKINTAIENSAGERKTTAVRYLLSVLHNIKSMLNDLEDKTDNTTEWIKLTTHGMTRFQCKKCDSIFSLPWEHCPKCGRKVTNNIKANVHRYNYETGKLEEVKEDK